VKDMAKLQTPEEVRETVIKSIEACSDLIGMEKDEIKKLKKEAKNYKDNIDEYIRRAFRVTSCETTIKGLNVLKELYEKYLDGQLDKQSRDLLRRAVILHNSIFFERKPDEIRRLEKEKFVHFQDGFKKGIDYAKRIKKK
jgi:hypothetical protein